MGATNGTGTPRRLAAAVAAGAVGFVLAGFPGPALAAPGESIPAYDVRLDVGRDGGLAVTETIGYDFGGGQRHGIVRRIPVRRRYDDTRDRILPLDSFVVAADGAEVPVRRSRKDGYEIFTIGDPDRTVTGRHTYRISYRVRGAVRSLPDHDELYWNAVGEEWTVPVAAATVTVAGPAAVRRTECYAGPGGSRQHCAEAAATAAVATFRHAGLASGSAMTVVVAYPAGSVARQRPVLVDRRTVATAFRVTPATVTAAAGLAVLELFLVLVLLRLLGSSRGARPPGDGAGPGLLRPHEIRPAQAGALRSGRPGRREIAATIVDLAVRRHLHIRELHAPRRSRVPDWELTELAGTDSLLPYERTLLRALFAGRKRVRLAELRSPFGVARAKALRQLDTDLVHQGWYRRSPARTRTVVRRFAFWAVVVSAGGTVALALTTHAALVGLGPVAGSLLVAVLAGRLPVRTARGRAMLARVRQLRRYLAEGGVQRSDPAGSGCVTAFSEYLPYAIVFGLAGRWTRDFVQATRRDPRGTTTPLGTATYWYDGGDRSGSPSDFDNALDRFAATAATSGTTGWTSNGGSSSSSGFSGFSGGGDGGGYSGGGDGGGGGGSW